MSHNSSLSLDDSRVEFVVKQEFPEEDVEPSSVDMDESILYEPVLENVPYQTGHWIERFGTDMEWHLEPIRRIVRSKEMNEWVYYCRTPAGVLVRLDSVRAPEEGLKRQFGFRPWVWQQWAFLRVENFIRFQSNHEKDFLVVDYELSAKMLFDLWFKDSRNSDFRVLFESKPKAAQEKLLKHLLTPFKLLNEVKDWDLKESNPSVYQYASFLGSGFITAWTVFALQLIIPLMILLYAVRTSTRFPNYSSGITNEDGNLTFVSSADLVAIFETNWDTFCNQFATLDQIVMNFVVFVVYTIRVLPDVFDSFYTAIGDKGSLNSKMNSLRRAAWDRGDDNGWMRIGYKLDRYMNSLYIALINVLMLGVLFLTESTIEIILNALAIEFVYNFDSELPRSSWYDPKQRYLRVSIVEVLLCSGLKQNILEDDEEFCQEFDIDLAQYRSKVGGSLADWDVALKDDSDPRYMINNKDRLYLACAKVAKKTGRTEAVW
jgi:hypothetical protein